VRFHGIIFDFDGVIADSEILSNAVLAEALTELGHPTTRAEAIDRYIGLHWTDTCAAIEARIGAPLPSDFREATSEHFHARIDEVRPVLGIEAFLEAVPYLPKAVASSSPTEWLRASLERFGLARHFGARLFSAAEHVQRGKPHPDIYLHAAKALGLDPARLLVIEDTPLGVRAGAGAGATVVGLCAAGHCAPGYGDRLRAAGAAHIARSYEEVLGLLD
jgi:HAD superfamily hydrolase (TIGR01509 family)